MDAELRSILRRMERLIATEDELSALFAVELARVWRDAERSLRTLVLTARPGDVSMSTQAVRAVVLRDQVRELLAQAGYDALVAGITETSAIELIRASMTGRTATEIARLIADARPTVDALRRIAATDLLAQGDEVATALWRSLTQHLFTSRPVSEILADLSDAFDVDASDIQTLFDTQVSIFGRQVEAAATEDLGDDQPFLYVGPIDDRTRDFCLERVGKVFTRAEIEQMDNGQLPNPLMTAGGYSCRHSWIAVESAELRAMAGTDERVPEVAGQVTRAKERRQAKARKKAA